MEDDLPPKKMQPRTNLQKADFFCNFKEQHSTVISRQPDKHKNQIYIGTIKKKSTSIGCDIIVK